jgi:hypothetical protein
MSDVIDRPPTQLTSVEFVFGRYGMILPHGADWRQVFNPAWWEHCANRLRSGDAIEIHSFDHSVQFTLHILSANHRTSPPLIVAVARPILPFDLELPTMGGGAHAAFAVQTMSGARLFEVRDADGIVIADNLNRDAALDRAAAAEMTAQAAAAEALQLVEALSQPQPLPHTRIKETATQPDQQPIDWKKKTEEAEAKKGRAR